MAKLAIRTIGDPLRPLLSSSGDSNEKPIGMWGPNPNRNPNYGGRWLWRAVNPAIWAGRHDPSLMSCLKIRTDGGHARVSELAVSYTHLTLPTNREV